MPAAAGVQVQGERFHVVGCFGKDSIVSHTGLMASTGTLTLPAETEVFHCAPPLEIGVLPGGGHEDVPRLHADVAAWMDLTTEERQSMETWFTRIRTRLSALSPADSTVRVFREYVVYPHTDVYRDRSDR